MNLLDLSRGVDLREELLKAFEALEGARWFWESISRPSGYSVHDALKWLDETRAMLDKAARAEWNEKGGDFLDCWRKACAEWPESFCLYGNGGWHRFFVRPTGELVFSSFHAPKEVSKEAEALGFRIG